MCVLTPAVGQTLLVNEVEPPRSSLQAPKDRDHKTDPSTRRNRATCHLQDQSLSLALVISASAFPQSSPQLHPPSTLGAPCSQLTGTLRSCLGGQALLPLCLP